MIRYARYLQKFCKSADIFDVAVIGGGSGGLAFALVLCFKYKLGRCKVRIKDCSI